MDALACCSPVTLPRCSMPTTSVPARGEFSENSVDALVGIGTSLNFLEIYDFRLEYQRVFDAGDEATGEGDVDMISVGVTVVF